MVHFGRRQQRLGVQQSAGNVDLSFNYQKQKIGVCNGKSAFLPESNSLTAVSLFFLRTKRDTVTSDV
jgi:hypothetical protein